MPQSIIRKTLIRLTGFAALWLVGLSMELASTNVPHWITETCWMALFSVPAILMMLFIQRLAHYRILALIEFFSMPFIIGGVAYVAIAIRS